MVELQNVSVTYSSGVAALKNVSLTINDGDFAFVVGSSGAGKSTMIKLLLKEIDATEGKVSVNGYDLSKMKKRTIPEFRRTLGFVFQDFRLIQSMTVYENIAFVLRVTDSSPSLIKKRVPYVINLVGLDGKADSYPDELSGGEKQRVAIARALVNDPQLIIADEPTGNIDPELSYEIVELLKSINDQGTTILMVTHEHDLVHHFGGRILHIVDGELQFDDVLRGVTDKLIEEEALKAEEAVREMQQQIEEEKEIPFISTEEALIQDIISKREDSQGDDVIAKINGTESAEDLIAEIIESKDQPPVSFDVTSDNGNKTAEADAPEIKNETSKDTDSEEKTSEKKSFTDNKTDKRPRRKVSVKKKNGGTV